MKPEPETKSPNSRILHKPDDGKKAVLLLAKVRGWSQCVWGRGEERGADGMKKLTNNQSWKILI